MPAAKNILTSMCAILVLCVGGAAAAQQVPCADRSDILKHMSDKFGEVPVSQGLSSRGAMVEVLSSGKTWTIIVTTPNGITCMVGAGESWQNVPAPKKGQRL
jgi:hypothetical protein